MLEYVKRAWGAYEVLRNYDHVKLKILHVDPGKSLSMQRHFKRDELWFVVAGSGYLKSSQFADQRLYPKRYIKIDKGMWHQIINTETQPLIIIEIQYGEACEEKDIERQN